jgi:AbrB family looped-hinge helix DNA binding protein
MTSKITMDKAGRVILPKPVRDELQLGPGDTLEIESSEDQIVLRPARGTMPLRKKSGIWVVRTGEPLSASTVEETLRQVRAERDGQNSGSTR